MKTKQEIEERIYAINEQVLLLAKEMDEDIWLDEKEYTVLWIRQQAMLQERNGLKWVIE
jgi:hypothetical protein